MDSDLLAGAIGRDSMGMTQIENCPLALAGREFILGHALLSTSKSFQGEVTWVFDSFFDPPLTP